MSSTTGITPFEIAPPPTKTPTANPQTFKFPLPGPSSTPVEKRAIAPLETVDALSAQLSTVVLQHPNFMLATGVAPNDQKADTQATQLSAIQNLLKEYSPETIKAALNRALPGTSYTPMILAVRNGPAALVRLFAEQGANLNPTNRPLLREAILAKTDSSAEIAILLLTLGTVLTYDDLDCVLESTTSGGIQNDPAYYKKMARILDAQIKPEILQTDPRIGPLRSSPEWKQAIKPPPITSRILALRQKLKNIVLPPNYHSGRTAPRPESSEAAMEALSKLLNSHDRDDITTAINQYGTSGSVLTYAIENGDIEIVKKLAEYGARLNEPDGYRSPLGFAIAQENERMVAVLLELGAKPNDSDLQQAITQTGNYSPDTTQIKKGESRIVESSSSLRILNSLSTIHPMPLAVREFAKTRVATAELARQTNCREEQTATTSTAFTLPEIFDNYYPGAPKSSAT